MAETKYGKYFGEAPIKLEEGGHAPLFKIDGAEFSADIRCILVPVVTPMVMVDKPHYHDFDQILCFIGSDPYDMRNFGAEIELSMGEEGEKHIITSPTLVHLPKGLVHCPLEFKRVDKPVFHLELFLGSEYEKKATS